MSSLPAEFVEREYNLRAAFPDHPQWFARWAVESAAARARLESRLDVRYGGGPKQTMDLFPVANARGTLVFIHGGYWRSLDKSDHSFVAPPMVSRDIGVAVINYDLCPQVDIARIVDECREAIVWLRREGPSHGLKGPLVVSGHSAGGHLAAMLAATDWQARGLPADTLHAAVTISGVFDLEPLVQASFNVDLGLDAAHAYLVSPIHLLPRVAIPVLIAAGAEETSEFVRQSWLLWERWPDCHPLRMRGPLLVPARHHFGVISDLADSSSELTRRTLDLF